jgi:hypothetical protein
MIKIDRPPAPAFLIDPMGDWQDENERAKSHYANGLAGSFDFKLYSHPRLKDELKKIFVKCAYCESAYAHVYDGDVEHFRPKCRIAEKTPQIPGYFWLANDWNNLFLACQHCNQNRKHILFDDTRLRAYGKLDQFPLSDETRRVTIANDLLDLEEPARLLINPCIDNPSEHLEYEETNAVVRHLSPKGEASIKVYVLQRPMLVQERKKMLIMLFKQIADVKDLLVLRGRYPTDGIIKRLYDKGFDELLEFGNQDRNYAGMCRFFIKKFLVENGI